MLSCGDVFPPCGFPTDSNPDCCADSKGGSPGLPEAMARADPCSARICEGSRWPAAAQSPAYFLSRHQNLGVQTACAGQTPFPRCKYVILVPLQFFFNQQFSILFFAYFNVLMVFIRDILLSQHQKMSLIT